MTTPLLTPRQAAGILGVCTRTLGRIVDTQDAGPGGGVRWWTKNANGVMMMMDRPARKGPNQAEKKAPRAGRVIILTRAFPHD